MRLVHGIQQLGDPPGRTVVTIGNFDGVHLGHQAILRLALEKAGQLRATSVAFTFRPHPRVALNPETPVALLCTYDERLELLTESGLALTVEEPFGREFSRTSPEQFFTDALLRRLSAQAVVVGYDFAFGKDRHGHLDTLERLCRRDGVELTVVPPLRVDGEVVSSSSIRKHLKAGDVPLANKLLGRPFFYRGVVLRGEGRGRKIGFPTANLGPEGKLVPSFGVYATRSIVRPPSGKALEFLSVTNIGVRPTFNPSNVEPTIETHLFDYAPTCRPDGPVLRHADGYPEIDLYGLRLEVRFVRRLREERKFAGVDELRRQISTDVELARAALT